MASGFRVMPIRPILLASPSPSTISLLKARSISWPAAPTSTSPMAKASPLFTASALLISRRLKPSSVLTKIRSRRFGRLGVAPSRLCTITSFSSQVTHVLLPSSRK
ncbi:hypothetical protein D3C72_1922410 [compost metagenome]